MKTGILTFLVTVASMGLLFSQTPTNSLEPTCFIAPVVDLTSIACDDNDTPYDPSDDMFTFDVNISSGNDEANTTGEFMDDQGNTFQYSPIQSPVTITQSYGPFLITNGNATIMYEDEVDPGCGATLVVTPPDDCPFATCEIIPEAATNILCNDNGTPYDDSDDTFTFDITVGGSNTEASASNTFTDDQGNSAAYG